MIGGGGGHSLIDTAQAVGAPMEGVYDVDFPQITMNPAGAPGLGDFVVAYQKKFSMAPRSGHSLANYVGAKAMLEVLARAKSTDKDKIRDAALAFRAPVGSTAAGWGVQFNETGQNTAATLNLMQWQQGKLATVFPEAVANAKPLASN